MIEVPVYNQSGEKIDAMQIDEQKLGGDVNAALLKQALVMYHANQRQGTAKTKGRGEVAGSTRKLYKQKGTGNARTGGIRNPIKKGGGHAKQKNPKDWRQDMPAKARRAALDSAILQKLQSNEVCIVDKLQLSQPKTKEVAKVFKALGLDRGCCIAINGEDSLLVRSARNIPRTTLTTVRQLNAWDVMNKRKLLVTKEGMEQILA
jgi:large subunit ribosomal protein L4